MEVLTQRGLKTKYYTSPRSCYELRVCPHLAGSQCPGTGTNGAVATHWVPHISNYVQSNPARNTDTDGAIESFRINGVSVFSRSSNLTKKYTFFEQNTKEIKQLGDWNCLTEHL